MCVVWQDWIQRSTSGHIEAKIPQNFHSNPHTNTHTHYNTTANNIIAECLRVRLLIVQCSQLKGCVDNGRVCVCVCVCVIWQDWIRGLATRKQMIPHPPTQTHTPTHTHTPPDATQYITANNIVYCVYTYRVYSCRMRQQDVRMHRDQVECYTISGVSIDGSHGWPHARGGGKAGERKEGSKLLCLVHPQL